MKLIGMLDSPFVRRVAISMRWLELNFEHEAISVFADFDKFHSINPLVRAPTFVCDDGTVLMDSSHILQYVELKCDSAKTLYKQSNEKQQELICAMSIAQITAEKLVQLYYEMEMRPQETRFAKWEARIRNQIVSAFGLLEHACEKPLINELNQASIAIVTACNFHEEKSLGVIEFSNFPKLEKLWRTMEASDLFKEFEPLGPDPEAMKIA